MFAECCVFIKQSQPPILCHLFTLLHATQGIPSPEVTVSICRVPSPGFSQAPENTHPAHQCRFAVRSHTKLKLRGFSWNHCLLLREAKLRSCHTLDLRYRICLVAISHASTGTSNTRTTFRDPSPHRTWLRCRNINLLPIDYGFRPRLRGRLTLRR